MVQPANTMYIKPKTRTEEIKRDSIEGIFEYNSVFASSQENMSEKKDFIRPSRPSIFSQSDRSTAFGSSMNSNISAAQSIFKSSNSIFGSCSRMTNNVDLDLDAINEREVSDFSDDEPSAEIEGVSHKPMASLPVPFKATSGSPVSKAMTKESSPHSSGSGSKRLLTREERQRIQETEEAEDEAQTPFAVNSFDLEGEQNEFESRPSQSQIQEDGFFGLASKLSPCSNKQPHFLVNANFVSQHPKK